MFVPLSTECRDWLLQRRPFRYSAFGLPNYPVETLGIVTPANDNRETHDPLRALILAQKTRRELGFPDHCITRRT